MSLMIITGASSGIGRGLAIHFSKLNYKIIATARRSDKLEETKSLGSPGQIIPVVSDVATEEGRKAIINKVKEYGMKVDVLIQNAGIMGEITSVDKITEESWLHSFNVNVHAPLFLVRDMLNENLFAEKSRILHMGSGAAHGALKGWPSYNVTKAAFFMLYKYLKVELQDKSIFVGSLKPGIVESEMQEEIRKGSRDVFPALDRFVSFKTNETTDTDPHAPNPDSLDTPENVAHFCEFLLTKLSGEEFSEFEWDIRIKEHRAKWINA